MAKPISFAKQPAAVATRRLEGVDGLRALAALWVVLFHIHAFSGARIGLVPGADLFMVLIALLPLIILIAWLLFISVERYTLTSSSNAGRPWWEQMAAWMRTAIRRPVLELAAATTARR